MINATQITTGNVARLGHMIDMSIIAYAMNSTELAPIANTLVGSAFELSCWDATIVATVITEVAASFAGATESLESLCSDLASAPMTGYDVGELADMLEAA